MRKHHKRWVALFGAAAIVSSGLVGLPGAAAEEKGTRVPSWPVIEQGASSYSLDGYEIGYLPEGLEDYGISASSVTDRMGNRQSQLSWVEGPDQLFGRVAVLRSTRLQQLDDLRSSRYSHLPDGTLQRLVQGEALPQEAYLSPKTGDLFWLEEPGVAVSMHLQPDRWSSGELVRMAESLTALRSEAEQVPEAEQEHGSEQGQETPAEAGGEESAETEEFVPVGRPGGPESSEKEESEGPVSAAPEAPEETSVSSEAPTGQGQANTPQEAADKGAVTQEPAEAGAPGTEEAAGGQQQESPEVQQAKECLIDRFVNLRTGETKLDDVTLIPAGKELIERVLSRGRITATERDRLLATVWYYGDERDKTSAIDDCARTLGLERSEVEKIVSGLAWLIAELVGEVNARHRVEHEENVARTLKGEVTDPSVDPVGAEEWQQLMESLPWSLPTTPGTDTGQDTEAGTGADQNAGTETGTGTEAGAKSP